MNAECACVHWCPKTVPSNTLPSHFHTSRPAHANGHPLPVSPLAVWRKLKCFKRSPAKAVVVVVAVVVVENPLPRGLIAYCSTYLSRSLVGWLPWYLCSKIAQHVNLNPSQSDPYMCVLRTINSPFLHSIPPGPLTPPLLRSQATIRSAGQRTPTESCPKLSHPPVRRSTNQELHIAYCN